MSNRLIDLQHITKSFGSSTILDDMSLYIRENEFLTLLGPSGCGKTTTLRIIGGFETPDKGQVLFDGKDITNLPPNKRQLNTVFQKYALFTHMNIAENIAFGLRMQKLPEAEIKQRVMEMLETVSLKGFEHRRIHQLSGGQQQRVAIARALAVKPKMMLFDEPTSALDPELRHEVLKVMQDLAEEGMTMVIVTHEIGFAEKVASRLIFIDKGRIAEDGNPQELVKNPPSPRLREFLQHVA